MNSAAVLPPASSGRQGSIPTAARRRQCRRSLQSFIANTEKLNFHLFPLNFSKYLNSPPSPSSLFGAVAESFLSWSQSLNFAISNNNMGEGRQGTSCFPCIGWKPTGSHTLPVILSHVEVGEGWDFLPPTGLNFSHNRLLPPQKALFHSPLLKFSVWSSLGQLLLFPCKLTKSVAECGIITSGSASW